MTTALNELAPAQTPIPQPPGLPDDLADHLPYHRLGRLPRPRWWRPILVALTALAAYVVLVLVAIAATMVADHQPEFDLTTPVGVAEMLIAIALMLPAAQLAVRVAGRRPAGTLSSVAGRIRWRLLCVSLAVTTAVMVPVYAATYLLTPDRPPLETHLDLGQVAVMLAIVVALVPLQAAAEEYVFRGLLPQLIGGWLRNPLLPYTLPVALFTIGHLYDLPGLVAVAGFGLVAGWLTWRSGGLELAIGLHVVNNVIALGMVPFGLVDPNATEVPWPDALISVGYTIAAALIMCRLTRNSELISRPRCTSRG